MKKRVVHIITGLAVGGAEMMLVRLLEKMDKKRFDSIVISLMGRGDLTDSIERLGIPVYTLNMKRNKLNLYAVLIMLKKVRGMEPDLIQGWMYHGNIAACFARLFVKGKVQILWSIHHSLHGLWYEKRSTIMIMKLSNYLSKYVKNIIYVAERSAIQHEKIGFDGEKRIVIPIGFDVNLFYPSDEARYHLRFKLGLSEDQILIGMIGRYHPLKDHKNFLEAASFVLHKYPNVHFVLVGREIDHQNKQLKTDISKLGLSDNIHLLGECRDVSSIMASLDISCLSSISEGFPTVVGEAMACGVPCVVTDVGDAALLVGNTGRVVAPMDPVSFSEQVLALLHLNTSEREQIGKMARKRILEHFSLPHVVTKYQELYDSVLK